MGHTQHLTITREGVELELWTLIMENDDFRTELAILWQSILQADPALTFGTSVEWLVHRNYGDEIPQPGFVGTKYREGGILFLAMNPAGGTKDGLGDSDQKQYEKLLCLRDASNENALRAFNELMDHLLPFMETWKIILNYVNPLLNKGGLTIKDVAYVNLMKWRTLKGANLNRLYDISWEAHTHDQLNMLNPGVIIAISKSVIAPCISKVLFKA
jgi:hypothetical protein